jgi:ATP-dependent DNA helicase RecQ
MLVDNIITLTSEPSTFSLLMAPPAWGKTALIKNIYEKGDLNIIYISPLKALANEFYERMKYNISVYNLNSEINCSNWLDKRKSLLVATAEACGESLFQKIHNKNKVLFVLDEIHLFLEWGDSFRPYLKEIIFKIANSGHSVLALSATVDNYARDEIIHRFPLGFSNLFILDFGNNQLIKKPKRSFQFLSFQRSFFYKQLLRDMNNNDPGVILFFCRTRYEVDRWQSYCHRHKISAIFCKGGEVSEFIKKYKNNSSPKIIFTTKALSHGVNLKNITSIYINYYVESCALFLQMVARGGREQQAFEVYSFNSKGLFGMLRSFFYLPIRDVIAEFKRYIEVL